MCTPCCRGYTVTLDDIAVALRAVSLVFGSVVFSHIRYVFITNKLVSVILLTHLTSLLWLAIGSGDESWWMMMVMSSQNGTENEKLLAARNFYNAIN